MPVQCCIARPASGKTSASIQKIQDVLAFTPFSRVWVIVPGSLQAMHFRRRLAQSGGAIGVTVGTFQNFSAQILDKNITSQPVAPIPFTYMLLRQVVAKIFEEGKLNEYKPIKDFPGFYAVLRDAFRELKFAFVEPAQFLDVAASHTEGVQELAAIYQEYSQQLRLLGWVDSSDFAHQAYLTLQQMPAILAGVQLVVVDGFDSFTAAEVRLLQKIAQQVPEMFITLPGEVDSERLAHRRAAQGLELLKNAFPLEFVSPGLAPQLPSALAAIESTIFQTAPADHTPLYDQATAPKILLQAYSPEAEVREALRWLKARIVRDGVKPSECAIFSAKPHDYEPTIRLAATEFGLPVHFFRQRDFLSYPVGGALINLIDVVDSNYSTTSLFNFLRSPFFTTPVSRDQTILDDLDGLSRYASITEGCDQWDELFDHLLKAEIDPIEEEVVDYHRKALPTTDRVRQLRAELTGVFDLFNEFSSQQLTPAAWVVSFEAFLGKLGFYDLAIAEAGEKILEPFFESLRSVVLSESVLGGQVIDHAGFAATLRSTIGSLSLPEPIESAPNGTILVGSFLEARAVRYKAVCIVGLSEGNYPAQERPDPFLSEAIRKQLGLEPKLERDQASLFYQALTRSDQHILITRAYLTEAGEQWDASPYWLSIVEWLGKDIVETVTSKRRTFIEDAASEQELLFLAGGKLPPSLEKYRPAAQAIERSAKILRSRRDSEQFDRYDGLLPELSQFLSSQFSPEHAWSASRLETYSACHYYFYSQNVLKLEERLDPEEDYDVGQLGSIFHLILERLYRQVRDNRNYDELRAALPAVAAQVFADAPTKFGFRASGLWQIQQKEIQRALSRCLDGLQVISADWKPIEFEKKFGFGSGLPYTMQVADTSVRLHGAIDRIDQNIRTGEIRVIDYKSGGSMDKKAFEKKQRIQFVLYALAVEEFFKLGFVSDSIYWSLNSAKAIGPRLDAVEKINMMDTAKETVAEFVSAIRAGDFKPVAPEEGCPNYCPAAKWCWHYVPKEI